MIYFNERKDSFALLDSQIVPLIIKWMATKPIASSFNSDLVVVVVVVVVLRVFCASW